MIGAQTVVLMPHERKSDGIAAVHRAAHQHHLGLPADRQPMATQIKHVTSPLPALNPPRRSKLSRRGDPADAVKPRVAGHALRSSRESNKPAAACTATPLLR